ncbi:MAG: PTS cellobiose transporter subunit IIC [Gammaproteobacteria bacterium GWE2_42_36]|nr:MAG: PTS cellobiose transporter subunit IIC [Gammaproteobacteria bacterium GWE2_42_36]
MQSVNSKQFFYFCAIALFLSFPCISWARVVSDSCLPQLVQEVIQNNPQIKSAYDRWYAAKYNIPQSRSLPDPNVDLGYTKMSGNADMNANKSREQMMGVSQEIPFPSKLFVRGDVATSESERAKEVYDATRVSVIAQLKQKYYELYFINKSIEISEKNQLILENMQKSASANYRVGKASQQDMFRAQSEISRLLMRLVMLRQERDVAQADINRLLNRSLDMPIPTPSKLSISPLKFNLAQYNYLMDNRSPQILAQEKSVEKSRQTVRLSKLDYAPDIDVGVDKLRDTAMHTQGYQVMVSASIPLYASSKQNNEVRESLSHYNAEQEDLYAIHRDLSFQVKDSFLQAQRSSELIRLLQHTLIPQSTLTFLSSQASYGVGKVDFLTWLNSLLTLQDNELDLENEIVQHEKSIAQLEEITGASL